MKHLKKLLLSLVALVLIISLSSCNLIQKDEEKDRETVVAKVNGEKILKGAFLDEFDRQNSYYQVSEEQEDDFKLQVLDLLINRELMAQKAEGAGHTVTDEILKDAESEYDDQVKSYANVLKSQDEADEEEIKEDDEYLKLAKDGYEENLSNLGMTKDDYLKMLAEDIVIQNYTDELTKDLTITDEEIEDYYNEQLVFQTDNPSTMAYYSSIPTIVEQPAERLVKHVLIKISDEDSDEIAALRKDGKDEEADDLLDEKLAGIKDKAEDVLKKAKDGEDFNLLVDKYGEDPGMESEENKDGYKLLRDSNMVSEFLDASFTLEEGEISDLVATDYGYHIIKVYEASDDVILSLDEVHDNLESFLLENKKSKEINNLLEEWLEAAEIKKYEKRL